jgi:acetyltransferase-like isoleucine patch superfamily enzyme
VGWFLHKIRTRFWTAFYYTFARLFFDRLGEGCRFEGWIEIPQRSGRITLSDRVYVCRGATWTVLDGATLSMGNGAFIGPGVMISAHRAISIGNDSLVAEYVSIYDNEHVWSDMHKPIGEQGYATAVCGIGSGCWIGAGAKILMGGSLGDDCILGAGAVLKKPLPPGVVAAGVPARIIKHRDASSRMEQTVQPES